MDKFITKQVHCGQYKRYGDFFRVWNISTNEDETSTLDYCFSELYKHPVPESREWHRRIQYGDANYYFSGYYSLEKIDDGYEFSICKPFTD